MSALTLCTHGDCDRFATIWATDGHSTYTLCPRHHSEGKLVRRIYLSEGDGTVRINGVSVELTPDLADALGTYRYTTPAEQVGESLDYLRRHLPEELDHTPADIDAAWAEDVGGDAEEVVPFVGAWSYCGVRCG